MLFRTMRSDIFVEAPTLAFMTAATYRAIYSEKPDTLPLASFQWSNDRECLTWDKHNRATIVGGLSVYLDIFGFAFESIYRKGTDARRGRYAESLTNRMMFGDEHRRPKVDELRGIVDAMIDRTDIAGERAHFKQRGVEAIERLAARPTIEIRAQ